MARKTLEEFGVEIGADVVVMGEVVFSQVANRVDGDYLEQKIKRERDLGIKHPEKRPHYEIKIKNPVITKQYAGTPFAEYIEQFFYEMKDGDIRFDAVKVNSGDKEYPPTFLHLTEDEKVKQIELDGELNQGQVVQLALRTFGSKEYGNMGSGLQAILFPQGEIDYRPRSIDADADAFGYEIASDDLPF